MDHCLQTFVVQFDLVCHDAHVCLFSSFLEVLLPFPCSCLPSVLRGLPFGLAAAAAAGEENSLGLEAHDWTEVWHSAYTAVGKVGVSLQSTHDFFLADQPYCAHYC